jgi:hypothetical protein
MKPIILSNNKNNYEVEGGLLRKKKGNSRREKGDERRGAEYDLSILYICMKCHNEYIYI